MKRENHPAGRRHRALRAGAALLLSALAMPSIGHAAALSETEPNDTRFQENGPITVDGAQGVLQTDGDYDRFLVRLRPQRQVVVTYALTTGCADESDVNFWLDTASGDNIGAPDGNYAYFPSNGTPRTFTITTPGVYGGVSTDYHLGIHATSPSAVGCAYQFTITGVGSTGTDAIDASPGPQYPFAATAEPNDIDSQAAGPLIGDTIYTGTIETDNDIDKLWVPVKAGTGLTVELSAVRGGVRAGVSDHSKTNSYSSTSVSADGTTDTTSVSAGTIDMQYLISITGATGAQWRLRVTPPSSVGSTPVVPTPAPVVTPPVTPTAATATTITYRKRRYSGRVTSPQTACYRGVTVELRKRGKGAKSYGSTVTRQDGTWTIRRSKVKGKIYAYVDTHVAGGYSCGISTSRNIR